MNQLFGLILKVLSLLGPFTILLPRSAESVTVGEVILAASIDDSEDCAKKMVCLVNTMHASDLSPRYVMK